MRRVTFLTSVATCCYNSVNGGTCASQLIRSPTTATPAGTVVGASSSPTIIASVGSSSSATATTMRHQMRCYSDGVVAPSAEEVRKAHITLGTTMGTPFPEIRKRYLKLAKEHHPDVVDSSKKNSGITMGDINTAYDVLERNCKAGGNGGYSGGSSSGSSTSSAGASSSTSSSSGNKQNPHHQYSSPYGSHWGEDFGAAHGGSAWESEDFNEAMWAAMRGQQAAGRAGGRASGMGGAGPYMDEFEEFLNYAHKASAYDDNFRNRFRPGNKQNSGNPNSKKNNNNKNNGGNQSSSSNNSSGNKSGGGSSSGDSKGKEGGGKEANSKGASANFTATELAALRNMYEEGKSFEFIANALKKSTEECMQAYNESRGGNNNKGGGGGRGNRRNNRNRGGGGMGGGGMPFGRYVVMDEDDMDAYNVYFDDVYPDEGGVEFMDFGDYANMINRQQGRGPSNMSGGPRPFTGRHYMHRGGGGGGGGGRGRGRGGGGDFYGY